MMYVSSTSSNEQSAGYAGNYFKRAANAKAVPRPAPRREPETILLDESEEAEGAAEMPKKPFPSRSKSGTGPEMPRACSSANSITTISATTPTSTPMMTIPQPLNYGPQTFNFPSATFPLPIPLTNTSTSPAVPITIDPLAHISEVYFILFYSLFSS